MKRPVVLAGALWLVTQACGIAGLVLQLATLDVQTSLVFGRTTQVAIFAAVLAFSSVGAVVIARQPRNLVGWLLGAIALAMALGTLSQGYGIAAHFALQDAWPAGPLLLWISSWLWVPAVYATVFLLLLFPDGQLRGPRWQVLAWLSAVGLAALLGSLVLQPGSNPDFPSIENPVPANETVARAVPVLAGVGYVLLFVGLLGAAASLLIRFRRARGEERLQLKWIAYAGMMLAVVYVGFSLAYVVVIEFRLQRGLLDAVFGVLAIGAFTTLPVAIGVAVLRYRLYDIDILINRTLVYGALSAVLGAGYVATVFVLQAVLGSFTGGGQLEVAIATLLAAAAFRPLRNAIQRFIDRRFYRAKYDAQRTVAAFAARLRDEVELETISADLVAVVDETVAPVRIWLSFVGSAPAVTISERSAGTRSVQ